MLRRTAARNLKRCIGFTIFPTILVCIFPGIPVLAIFLILPASGHAQTRDMVVAAVDANNRVRLTGHHPAWAVTQNDLGAVPADLQLQHLEIVLARPPEVQQAFEQFLAAQQDPTSPQFHQWLTPAEIGAQFGASDHDIAAITDWLQSQNLHVDSIANSRVRIAFSGPASAIGNAFGAQMHYFNNVSGEERISIADEPQIPAALTGIVKSVSGLFSAKITSSFGGRVVQVPASNSSSTVSGNPVPELNGENGTHFIAPADFATIYDLPGGTINGQNQTIAIIGRARVDTADISNFASLASVPANLPNVIIPPDGIDPGPAEVSPPTSGNASGDQGEATLDVSRAGSVATGATIDLVVSADTSTADGIEIAAEYVVDPAPTAVFAQVMSISFASCEGGAGPSGTSFWNSVFSEAAAEGISAFVGSGDAGAAGCDAFFSTPPAMQSLSINSICASSYATCVGGTEFNDASNPGAYWSSTQTLGYESALGYIPEGGWNEPTNSSGGPEAAASGGGFSIYIPTPSWQTGTGVPGTQGRYTPDVSFSASGHDGYFGCYAAAGASCVVSNGGFSFEAAFGTSATAPDMAGIAALLNQRVGAAQGNLNPELYKLAAVTSNNIFHDVTVATSGVSSCVITTPSMCNNSTPSSTSQTGGLSGYLVGAGYDEATGLGSIDVAKLISNWSGAATTTAINSAPNPSIAGHVVAFNAVITVVSGPPPTPPTGTVTFFNGTTSMGAATLNTSGVTTLDISSLNRGSYSITGQYSGDTNFLPSTSATITQVVNGVPTTVTVVSSANPSAGGQTVTFTATVAGTGGTPTGSVSFLDGTTSIDTATLSGGVATFSTASLIVASHSITAQYAGDNTFAPSTSNGILQVITGKSSSTALVSSPNPSVGGQSVALTATVTGSGGTPTGTVTFLANSGSLGTAAVNAGVATLTATALQAGTDTITAQYSGDTSFGGSLSAAVTQTVSFSPSSTTLSTSLNSLIGGQSVTFSATVTSSLGMPTGNVAFLDGANVLGAGNLTSGAATFSTTTLGVGSHSITAMYSGNAILSASTSAAVTESVSVAGFATPPSSIAVTDGSTVIIPLTLYEAPASALSFQLSCSGLPASATCSFNPASVIAAPVPNGTTIQLSFATASPSSSSSMPNTRYRKPTPWKGIGLVSMLAFLLASLAKRRDRFVPIRAALATGGATIALAVLLVGCGSSGTTATATSAGTPKGAVTFMVSAVSGSTTVSVPVTVTVQ